jgi:hypothetical protein
VAIRVTGAAEIAAIAAACRSLGVDRSIVNDMAKEIRKAVPPIRRAVKVRAVQILPHRGGLGSWVAKARITSSIRTSGNSAGVKIKGGRNSRGGRSDLKAIDAGQVRHPTWGHRPWSAQAVRAGFFTDAATPVARDHLERAVLVAADHAAERILHA